MNKNSQRVKNILSKLRSLALRIIVLFAISLQQIHPELFLLPAYADSPNPNTINFTANINSRENNFAQGTSDIKFQIQAPSGTIVPTNTKFTVFLFFGDNLYTSYKSFTASYDQFPLISYKYNKAGVYKPLLIIYSNDLKSKLFKFLDPITVEKHDIPNEVPEDGSTADQYVKASDLKVNIVSRINQAPLLDSKVTYSITSDNLYMSMSKKKFTVFLFYGDNFYRDYYSFTAPYSGFPQAIIHEYKKAGKYTPLLIAYSYDLTDKIVRFLDPIVINQAQGDKPIAQGIVDGRIDSRENNTVTVNFNGSGSFDPRNNSHENLTYIWDYGDGISETITSKVIQHIYRTPGIFNPSLIAKANDGKLSDKYQLAPIIITKDIVCLDSRDTWTNVGICQANCGGINAEQLQVNACGEEKFIPCTSPACKTNTFTILNEYIEANSFISLLADNGGFADKENLSYRFIIDSAVEEPREQIYQNSKFYLNQAGQHTVTLEIYEQSFKASSYTQTINVAEANKVPIAKAKADKYIGEVPLSINFDASESSDPENSNLTYEWTFGDGTSNNGKTLSHNFDRIGTYKTSLKVTDNRGLSSQINLPDIVVEEKNYPPVAKFVKNVFDCKVDNNGQVALEYKIDGTFACNIELDALFSSDPNGNISNYQWVINYYNPLSETNQSIQIPQQTNPKFVYKFNKFGNYDINLKVSDAKGLSSDYSSTLTILEPSPILKAELKNRVDNVEIGSSLMNFSANGSIYYRNTNPLNSGTEYLTYLWDWGDGFSSNGLELSHSYNNPGVYSPVLSVYKKNDPERKILASKNLESLVVTTKIPVVGSLSFDNLISLEENGTSSITGVTIGPVNNEEYKWIYHAYEKDFSGKTILIDRSNEINSNYGELNSSILDAPQNFTNAGQYQLVHQLDEKPILSETLTVLPNQIPIPKLQVTHETGSNTVSVSAEGSYDPKNYEIASYHWDFNDGTSSDSINTTHTYANNGVYYIKLTVVDSKGQMANAYSKAIIVGNFASTINNSIPPYQKTIDQESGDDTIPENFRIKLRQQDTGDPISDYDQVSDNKNPNASISIRDLSLPTTAGTCSGGACDCRKSYGQDIAVSSISFIGGNTSHFKEKGGALIEIKGSNFCKNEHNVKIKIDNSGDFIDRPSTFIDNNTIRAKLRSEDFKGNNITIRVTQKAADNKYYLVDKIYTNSTVNPNIRNYDVLDGNSVKIDFNADNFFFDESTGFGNGYHYFKDNYPTIFSTDALIASKKLSLKTYTANQAKLKVHLNGNRFEGIRVWINNVLVLSRDPAPGNKFFEISSDPFSISTGALDLKVKIIGPSDDGVQVKAITIYTAPAKPFINNFRLKLFEGVIKGSKRVSISMNTTPNTKLQAVHINRKSTIGTYKDKYIILEANGTNSDNSGIANLSFNEVNFKPGTHCTYFYLTNGSDSDKTIKEYIINNLVKPFNQAQANNKFAAINQNTFNYLRDNALPINHGICFNEDHNVTLTIQSPTSFIFQANNQPQVVKLQSDAPPQIKSLWNYEVKLLSGQDETNAIVIPWTKAKPEEFGPEAIQFPILRDYKGIYHLLIRASYIDPISLSTYVGEVSTDINIIEDVAPKAKVVTENINKLILEPSDNPAEKASFLGQYSYDPNRESFPELNDGIGSYSWITEFKSLESSPETSFASTSSSYDPNSSTYYIGPRKEPGIYRASLTVKDFYNNSDTAQSDTVQIIKPGQNLVAALSINNADKIFEPDLSGKKEIALKAKVKVIIAKNNKPSSLNYKFIYGDGIEESGTINLAQIEINKYIEANELTNRKHIYSQGEYDPRLEVSASFPDGHSETWTVSAGTLTIAKLPSYVAFTPIIANLAPKDIPNPGFTADLKVKSKAIYKTTVESFGWDFGDGTTWTYSGTNPTADFMKNNVTDKKHTYNNLGIFQIKFWVKTVDAAQPIIFALKPLEIQDTPAPIFKSLTVNQASTNIKVNDEEIITIAGEVETKLNLQRLELQVIAQGSNEVVFSKTYTGTVPKKFSETFNDLYLEPGNYVLALLAFDTLEQQGSGTLEFVVEKVLAKDQSIDISRFGEFYEGENFTSNTIHKIPIDVNKFLKVINIYNNDKKIKSFEAVAPDETRLIANNETNNGPKRFFNEVRPGEIYTPLHEGDNNIRVEVILPNGKIIKARPYLITLDSTNPIIEIESPLDISIHARDTLTLAGKIFDENLAKLFYRINSNRFNKLDFEEVNEELDLYEFAKDIDLNNENIHDSNFLEIKAVDKGGNIWYANTSFIVSDELLYRIRNKPKALYFPNSSTEDNSGYDLPPDQQVAGDIQCDEVLRFMDYAGRFMERSFTNVTGTRGGVYSLGSDGYYAVKQGSPFNVNFKLQVCDYSIGEAGTTTKFFPLHPYLSSDGTDYTLAKYGNEYFNNVFDEGGIYRYRFYENVAGLSEQEVYLEYGDMNNDTEITTTVTDTNGNIHYVSENTYFAFDKYDSIHRNWKFGKYDFHSTILFESGHKFINGTYPDADERVGVNIVSAAPGESIQITNVDRIPQVIYIGHDIDEVIITARVALFTDEVATRRFQFYIDGPKTTRITRNKNDLDIRYFYLLDARQDPYGRYLYDIKFTAHNLPQLTGKENINDYKYLVQLLNEAGDSVAASDSREINILPAPERYVYVKAEEVFPENYTDEQKLKEEGFVSNNPKQFKLTVYHIDDNGLTLQEKLDGFNAALSPILSRLKIRKISLDNLDQFAENGNYGEKAEWNGDQLSFNLVKDSVLIHPINDGLGLFTKKELEDYKDYWKTEYISSGPDDGKTLIKDAGKLEFDLHMEDWFAKQKEAGFGFGIDPKQFDTQLYDLDPYPIDLENLEISTDSLFFQPNIERIIAEPEKLYLSAGKKIFSANLSYEDKITNKYRLPKFEYKPRKEKTNEEKKKIKAGFLIHNQEDDDKAFVALSPFSAIDDINLNPEGSKNYTLDLWADLLLNNDINALLKKDEMVNLNENKTLQVPISIITKSDKDLDIELRGTYTQKAFPVSILDLPKFELMQGKRAKKLNPEELAQQSAKITLDSKDNLLFHAKYSNIVGKGTKSKVLGFDPLELEVQLYDGGGLALGESFPLNKTTMAGSILSTIESKGYDIDRDDISINKTMNVNLSQYMPTSNKEFAEEAEYVRVKLKRDFTYLQGIIPAEENIYQYYDVDDNDLYRSKYIKITSDRRNTCSFSFPGSSGQHKVLTAFNESSINGNLLVNFTSASRKKAKIWVTYITPESIDETNITFAGTSYTSANLINTKNPTTIVEVDPGNNRVEINEGIFNFNDIDLPKINKYTLLFKVAESSASENSVNWTGSDANKAAVCAVDIVKGISDAQVFIDRLAEPDVINEIPINKDYEVIIRTDPVESIVGVTLYIQNMVTNKKVFVGNSHAIHDGAYITVNLGGLGLNSTDIYKLIANLTYNPNGSNEQKTDEKAFRYFKFVADTEPIVTFGTNGINDLGDPGSGINGSEPNVIYAPAGIDYPFNRTVMFTGIKEEDINKISFKLIDRITNQEAPNPVTVSSTNSTGNIDEYAYSISTTIPFKTVEDIKEYILEAYFDNHRLSQTAELFIIDDPKLEINFENGNISFDEDGQGLVKAKIELKNAFDREIQIKVESFIDGDSNNEVADTDESEKLTIGIDKDIELEINLQKESSETNASNTSQSLVTVIIRSLQLLLTTPQGRMALSGIAAISLPYINQIKEKLSTASAGVFDAVATVKHKEFKFYGDLALLDLLLYKNGQKLENNSVFEGAGNYEIQVVSSRAGTVVIRRQGLKDKEEKILTTVEIGENDCSSTPYFFPLIDNPKKQKSNVQCQSRKITIPIPELITGTNIGIATTTISIQTQEEEQEPLRITQISTKEDLFSPCVFYQMFLEAQRSHMTADKAAIVSYIDGFLADIDMNALQIILNGISTTHFDYTNINPGSGRDDLERLLPKTNPEIYKPTWVAEGYCKSLASHIVHHKERSGMFRLFESKNHRTEEIADNYIVYWFGSTQLGHIYGRHGSQIQLKSRFDKNGTGKPHTKFNIGDDIIDLIRKSIIESGNRNRSANKNDSSRPVFQTTYTNKCWFDDQNRKTSDVFMYIEKLQLTDTSYRVGSFFPLSPDERNDRIYDSNFACK